LPIAGSDFFILCYLEVVFKLTATSDVAVIHKINCENSFFPCTCFVWFILYFHLFYMYRCSLHSFVCEFSILSVLCL